MGMILAASHRVLELACRKAYLRYRLQADQLEKVQRKKLKQFLKEIFAKK